jgi:spoIIIJ-associated protein
MLIGHHGDTLDALQYLANLASAQKNNKGEKDKSRVTVNIEGYRAKREETLRTLARAKAAQALRTHRNVSLEPMSPYERRIIHSEIQSIEGVSTNSVGSENNRKVVIFVDKKPAAPEVEAETVSETSSEE